MQTIKRETHQDSIEENTLDEKTLGLLRKPYQDIDLPFLRGAIEHLRLTVDKEISRVVNKLGSTAIDLAGTGGSGTVKFNTSTAAAFVVAAHGVDVIKFGNRSITGTSGSLDFLSALGCIRDANESSLESVLKSTNLLFLSAPMCYPSLALLREERKKLGRPTIFNFIGPLLNPAKPAYRLFGISNSYMHLLINQFIKTDGITNRAITVHSSIREDYSVTEVDELLPFNSNTATLIEQSLGGDYPATVKVVDIPNIESRPSIDASQVQMFTTSDGNLKRLPQTDTCFNEPLSEVNAKIFKEIINGNDTESGHYHGLILNAGAAFLAAGSATSLEDGIATAKRLIANNTVARKLEQVRRVMS